MNHDRRTFGFKSTCPIPSYSCTNSTPIGDTCCSPAQGLVLVTQFWDTHTGRETHGQRLPPGHWGIHGMWLDYCDGEFGQYCDLNRQYDPSPKGATTSDGDEVPAWKGGDMITPLLQHYGKEDLLTFMNKYWVNQGAANWVFWQHEFSKHATCFSTFDVGNNDTPNCYGDDYPNDTEASIIDFIEAVVRAQLQFPTYQWLSDAGIVPSNSTTYNLADISSALTNTWGASPYLGCRKDSHGKATILDEIWYYSHSLGAPQSGIFKPVDQTDRSSCSTTLPIHYYARSEGSEWEA